MNLTDIRRLYAYDEWANERVFRAVHTLTEEQFRATMISSFPSIAATLAHIVGAEWLWLQRFQGSSPASAPDWVATAALPRLRDRLNGVELERAAFLDSLDESFLSDWLAYRNLSGEEKRGGSETFLPTSSIIRPITAAN